MKKINSNILTDFTGGFTGAFAVLPQTIGLSVLLASAMGFDASQGAVAGLMGAVVLLLFSGITGATTGMISAPNGPVTILLSGLIAKLSGAYSPKEIFIIVSLVLFFTGVFEIIFGLLKGGELIKLIPYPVVASMISAIGILMIKSQIKSLLPSDGIEGWLAYFPMIVALVTIISIFLAGKFIKKLPSVLTGLVVGMIFFLSVTHFTGLPDSHWVIGVLPKIDFHTIINRFNGVNFLILPWELIITSALALTVLVMIDCLLTALVADSQTGERHDSRKELIAQGSAQMVIGFIGGIGGGGTKGSTLANIMAGGRRWSPVFASGIILLLTVAGRGIGAYLPLSALSGVIIFIGLKMININIFFWFKNKETFVDALNAVLVITATIFLDVTKAVGLGLLFSTITFLKREISRPLIRRKSNIFEYPSPVIRTDKQKKILSANREKALLIELQGDLFFATTDQLFRKISELLEGRHIIVLHFRRVLSLDMSGMAILMQLVSLAEKKGTKIGFVHLHRKLGFGRKVKKFFSLVENKNKKIDLLTFNSTARALEYAENLILEKAGGISTALEAGGKIPFSQNDLCKPISSSSRKFLKEIAEKKKYKDHEYILSKGKFTDSIFLLTEGFVEQRLYNKKKSYKVLATYSPGTYFGVQNFFYPGKVQTSYVVSGNVTVYRISRAQMVQIADKVKKKHVIEIVFSIGRKLAKETNWLIREIHRLEAL